MDRERAANVDRLFSRCVLVYLEPEESLSLLSAIAERFGTAVFLNYEMINPHDPFGQVSP